MALIPEKLEDEDDIEHEGYDKHTAVANPNET